MVIPPSQAWPGRKKTNKGEDPGEVEVGRAPSFRDTDAAMAVAKMKLGARLPAIARKTLGRHSLALALFAVPLVSGTNLGGLSGGVHSLSGGQRCAPTQEPAAPSRSPYSCSVLT